jgi:HAD superfamily hydrolase (TIGR01509 family)
VVSDNRLRAVVFDVDGTLVDSVDAHARAWQDTFRHFGYDFPYAQVRHNVGKGADQYLATFLSKEEIERLGKAMIDWRLQRFESEYLPSVKPFPCVRELFAQLRRDGLRTALATSAKQDELESYLKLLNIDGLCEVRATADDAEKSKPHPDIFEAAVEKLDVRRPEALAVGDTPFDGQAAVRAGMPVIGLLCGGFPEHELRAAGCREIYRDPENLLKHWRSRQ